MSKNKKMQDLERLWDEWAKAHKAEENPDTEPDRTIPIRTDDSKKEIHKDNFLRDFVGTEYFNIPQNERVLFVLREANIGGKGKVEADEEPWINNRNDTDKKSNTTRKRYRSRMQEIYKRAELPNANNMDLTGDDINKIAYMNINKRGGYGSTNPRILGNYVKKYEKKLKREIEILEPAHIVCCGTHDTMESLLPNFKLLYDYYHPAYSKVKR